MRTGLELLLDEHLDLLRGRRVGFCCNPTAVTAKLVHAVDAIQGSAGVDIVRLFGPEHGIRGDAQDMIAVHEAVDAETGIPVVSLYGHDEESLRPPVASVEDLDVLVFDIQDIGSRYYTYVYTLAYCLEVCIPAGVQVIVCDRPNPIRGDLREGNLVDIQGFRSFVGRFPLPNRHGMTAGELAPWFCAQMNLDPGPDGLVVMKCEGWTRDQWFDETGLPWVMPSPNMPTLETAIVYPGQCLLEGTQLSEGRGTTRPFELFGAPWLKPGPLLKRMNELCARWGLEGIAFRACGILPTFQKHGGVACGGLQMHVTDRNVFRSLDTSVALLMAIRELHPDEFSWRTEAYEFVTDVAAIDLLSGDSSIRLAVEQGAELPDLQARWRQAEAGFSEQVRPLQLYP